MDPLHFITSSRALREFSSKVVMGVERLLGIN